MLKNYLILNWLLLSFNLISWWISRSFFISYHFKNYFHGDKIRYFLSPLDVYQWRILNALLPVGVMSDGACLTSQWQKTSGESIWPLLKSPYDVFRQPRVQGNNFDKE